MTKNRDYLNTPSKKKLFQRIREQKAKEQEYKCYWCAWPFSKDNKPTGDHLQPTSRGGKPLDPDNIVAACARCNNYRSNFRFLIPARDYLKHQEVLSDATKEKELKMNSEAAQANTVSDAATPSTPVDVSTPAPSAPAQASGNNLELNKGDQFLFALDVSASMRTTDCPGGLSRIQYAKESAKMFASEAAKYDPDGADYFTFGATVKKYVNQTEAQAHALIDSIQANEGSTDTAGVISAAWERAKELRAAGVTDNIVLMLITDGAPNDGEAVKSVIRGIADELENGEDFGMIFLTVGKIDPALAEFLKDLDDNLGAKFDIVDVKDFMSVNFVEAFSGATHD